MKIMPLTARSISVVAAMFLVAWGFGPSLPDIGPSIGINSAHAEPAKGSGNANDNLSGSGESFGGGQSESKGGIGAGGKNFGGFSPIGNAAPRKGPDYATGASVNQGFKNTPGDGTARGYSDLGNLNAARAVGYALGHPNPNSVAGQIFAYRDAIQQGGLTTLEQQRAALTEISNKPVSDAEVARVNELLGLPTPSL